MVVEELYKMPDCELKKLADERGIEYSEKFTSADRDFVIYALATFPKTDNVDKYVATISVGDIVAFRTSDYKVKSAKVVKKSTEDRKLMLETKYGKQFFIDFKDVVWVNSNGYWPKWIYSLMKENENAEAAE